MLFFALIVGIWGYLIGSIPVGYLLAKYKGVGDLRSVGSGSTGATNVVRQGGWRLGLLTLILDMGKGALATGAVAALFAGSAGTESEQLGGLAIAVTAIAAILGHVFPVWLRFKGGKGVAVYLGTLWVISPLFAGTAMIVWLLVAAKSRTSSTAAIFMVVWISWMAYIPVGLLLPNQRQLALTQLPSMLLILFTHRANIRRLHNGTEPKIELRRSPKDPS
jgi:glycerol-3-phosphate acyltransferase PlsY